MASLSGELTVGSGAVVIDQGDTGVDCYVIVEGTASVRVRDEEVAVLSAGDMVGEMALIDHRPRTASVVATSDMRLLRFNSRQFRQLLTEMPKAEERVMMTLTERLRTDDG